VGPSNRFQSFLDLTEESAQSWYKVRTYALANMNSKISLSIFKIHLFQNQVELAEPKCSQKIQVQRVQPNLFW